MAEVPCSSDSSNHKNELFALVKYPDPSKNFDRDEQMNTEGTPLSHKQVNYNAKFEPSSCDHQGMVILQSPKMK
jgi:hypothetical protein